MADYQLLGDTFGYHGYPANTGQNTSSQPGQPGLSLMPGSVGPGQSPYHTLQTAGSQPRPTYPQATDPLMSHKLHPNYAGYGSTPAAPSSSIRSQYSQSYMTPHGAMDSYPSLSMGQSHLSTGGHSLSGSYGPPTPHQTAMMSQYTGQRLHSPSSLHSSVRHPAMPSQYSPYSSTQNSSSYHSGSSSELWSSGQTMSHLQQSPFSNFQSPTTPGTSNTPTSTLSSLHANRTSQFTNEYASSSTNPYFPNHMSNDPSSTYSASYPTGPATQPSQTSSSRSSSASRTQQQYSGQIGSYNSSTQSTGGSVATQPNQTTGASSAASAASNSAGSRFSHYSPYSQSLSYDPTSQPRISPYSTPPTSSSQPTPNSPQYRSTGSYQSGSTTTNQLPPPVNSPRRSATGNSPAGSPMPPTSHTPGPTTVGSNSTQNSNQGSAFSVTNPSSSIHLTSASAAPSSLQQLEQMVMPHLGTGTSNTSSTQSTSSSTNTNNFYSTNTNSSPISPQSQSTKMFPHYSSTSSSAPSSQFPYHQYQPPPPVPQSGSWSSAAASQLTTANTHSLKTSSMMQQPLVHSAQHLSTPSSTNTNASKTHSSSESTLHNTAYSPYNSSKGSTDLPAENNEYSQSYNSSNAHQSSSSSNSSMSHSIAQSSYLNNSIPPTYENLSSQKQSSLKNDTSIYDHSKNSRSVIDSMSADVNSQQQSQLSNSYHSMMQSYGNQSMSTYPNQSRFEQPHSMPSSQYGISSNSYNTEHDASMIYDPYNIDNGLGIPPHQTMSEYRESQANLQQSGGGDYPQSDPYAANFDDYETTSKRKGKGRPKKDSSAPKKERKPRQPRTPTARGRGRGRGSKAAMEQISLPGMMTDYDQPSVGYGTPTLPGSHNESMDMYANNLDMYGSPATLNTANKMPSTNPMLTTLSPSINSVLPQPPSISELVPPSTYGAKPPPVTTTPVQMNQTNNSHLTGSLPPPPPPPAAPAALSRSPIPPQLPATTTPIMGVPSNYDAVIPENNAYTNYVNDTKVPVSDQPTIPNTTSTVCDNKDLVSNESTKTMVPSYEDTNFLVDSTSIKDDAANNTTNNNINHADTSTNNTMNSESSMQHSPVTTPPMEPVEPMPIDTEKSSPILVSKSFNPSSPSAIEPNRSIPMNEPVSAPIIQPSPIYSPIPPTLQPTASYDNVKEHCTNEQISVDVDMEKTNYETSFNLNSTPATYPPLNTMPNASIDLNSMNSTFTDESMMQSTGQIVASTPLLEKPKKKRRSKKAATDDATGETTTTMDEKPKIKKKRSKKVKEQTLDDTTILSTDLDDKTQLSNSNLEISGPVLEAEPKPVKRNRSKKKTKSEKSETNTTEGGAETSTIITDANGTETTTELAGEEKVKKPKVKNKLPKRKLPKLALKLKHNKKRRRGFGSPENSDLEKTPPPSPGPEDEAAIQKRRSARNTKRQRYNDDIDLDLSDEEFMQKSKSDDSQVMNVKLTEDTMVVEKILASRMAKRELELEPGEENNENKEPMFVEVEEYYVKYKNLSYLHCDWKTEDELEKGDRRINQKIRRYRQKKDINVFDFLDEEPFNPDYIEVDRILDVSEIEEIIEDPKVENNDIKPEEPDNKVIETDTIDKNEQIKTEVLEDDDKKETLVDDKNKEPETKEKEEQEEKMEIDDNKVEEIKENNVKDDVNMVVDEVMDKNTNNVEDNETKMDTKQPEQVSENETEKSSDIQKDKITKTDIDETINDDNKIDNNVKCEVKEDEVKVTTIENTNDVKTEPETVTEIPAPVKKTRLVRHYLVKWRGLSYEESTWELEDDIDDQAKIQQFWKFRNPPPKSEWKIKKKPKASEWQKLECSPTYKNGNTLREYQLEGVNWLSFCWHNGQNCILADEMGLGKTIQSITFIQEMVRYGIPYPYLVIAPLSTIGNWQREFETWTDLNVVTYHGSSPSRNMLQDYELYYKNDRNERIPNLYKFQVMITTFEVILTDCLELSSIKWIACIIDEAHRLKNRNCKLLEGLRMLSIEHRVLLTGTPLQNNVEELYSLLHFLEPAQFTSNENFMAEFGDLKTEAQVDKLKAILKPMMLRRLKEDVEKSLAPKEETIIEVELTNVQKKYYRAILERNFQFLSKGGTYANMPNLMNTVMELRKCCIHPFLINGAEEQIIQEFRSQHSDESTLNAIIQASGKLVLIDKLLPRLKDNGHRVLIFSQMVRCLDILEDYLCQKRYPYERIDGRVRGNLRQAAIDRFSKPDSDRFVFLLCTRAGGLGINLTAADTVIIFDSDWNPQNDLQAQARCHRIGQKKSVKVYRLICRNTYEREMFDRASLKLGLDKAVLQSINSQKNLTADNQMTKKEIEDLLRKGAYGALMEDDAAGDKFCEEDIDMILQRRTTKIVIESEGKGSTFSKASFATSDNRTDIEIDDPNFWEKWAKKANFDVDELKNRNELIVQEPRRRTQTKRFGADDAVLDISELDTSTDEEEAISMRTRGSKNRVSKKKRKGRFYDPEHDEDYAQEIGFGWTRSEFFKVEKGLLTFGWGRYEECLILANFKRNLSKMDVEDISRVILLFSLQNYKGDEKVKSFILDLITPPSERGDIDSNKSLQDDYKSRRSKKNKGVVTKTIGEELETLDWAKSEKYNPDIQIIDETYRKHLLRHANKILLRVRLLSYIKNDIIGDLHEKVFSLLPVRDIPLPYCQPDGDPPASWWNEEADKSLIIGVYKHGYDRYNLMRQDPTLCFLSRCGPPDGAALLAEITSEDYMVKMDEDEEPDTPATPATPQLEGKEDKGEKSKEEVQKENKETEQNQLPFPTTSEMNNRLRRLVTCYQRNFKKEEARIAQKARHLQRLERLEKFEAAIRERENKKREQAQKKWSRREESDFYRVVSSFGIEYNRKTDTFDWTRFRMYAKLEKKLDETLTEYFKAFFAMCKKAVGRRLTEDEENLPISVDPITEERANRCLARIDLLNKVREDILNHPELDERLKLCQPQVDLPDWWVCGKHDKDLLLGASKYGLNRLDYNLMNDPDLSFIEIVRNFEAQVAAEEKLASEFELEIRTILNSILEQIPDELEEKKAESEENVNDTKVTDDSKSNQDKNKLDEENTEVAEKKEDTSELQSNEIKENTSDIKETKPIPPEVETLMPITTTTQPRPQLKWPRDRVLQVRLENVCIAVEKNEWPTLHFKTINTIIPHTNTANITTADSSPRPSTPCSLSSASQEPTPHPTPDHTPRHETQSPFTGDYFYPNTNPPVLMNNFDDSNRKRRRRRRRFEMDSDNKTKLQSLLNSNSMDQHSVNTKINPPSNIPTPPNPNVSTNAPNPSSLLFKNNKTTNSLLNNIPSQFLSPLLNNIQFNMRSSFRDELLNDEKAASIFFGPQFAAALANASKNSPTATATSTANAAKALGLDTKTNSGNNQTSGGGPPPAHQSSSRNALALGSLDLTSKFKSAANPVLEKTTISPSRTNLPYPTHKSTSKNSPLKADALDLSSVPCKTTSGSSKSNSMANLLSQQFKKSNFPEQLNSGGNRPSLPANSKKRSKIGSRIDALALNLQAKKMMEEKQDSTNVPPLPIAASNKSLAQLTGHAGVSSTNLAKNTVNEKDLLAAFNSLSSQQHDKRQSFLEEFSKSQLLQSFKNNKNLGINVSQASQLNPANILGSKKSAQNTNHLNKVYSNMMESLKLYNKTATSTNQMDKNSGNDKPKPNLKSLLDENPDLLSQSSAFLSIFNNPLFNQSLAQSAAAAAAANSLLTTNTANNPSTASSSAIHNVEEKTKNTRSSKRNRSQFESPANNSNDEILSKRPLLNTPNMYQSLNMDPKKYLSSLLEKTNVEMKNIVKEKSPAQFKTPSVSSGTSSIRTRTSDKRAMNKSANASTSNSNTTNTSSNNNSATNFANMNASNLLNNLSLAAAAASGGTSKQQQQQQQALASSILANSYANVFNTGGKSNPSTNFTNSFANLGFNNNIFPSMKLFLDAATAAASAVSKGNSATSTSTPTCATATSATTTTTPALSSFANLFGMGNPLLNFSNFSNLANLNQTGNKKDGGIDFASLANSLASTSALSNLNASQNDDKGKSSKNSNSHSSKGSNSKNALNPNVSTSVNMLGSSSAMPFLYSNANFPLYNPLNFGLNNPFLNNPNLMNGLANFSNVFTSTTNTATSSSNVTAKTKTMTNKGNTKGKSGNVATSIASGLLAGVHPTSAAAAAAALDSDDESLKSLMGNEDEENLNGEFDNETPEKNIPKSSSTRRNKSHKQSLPKESKTRKSSSTSK